ncbi:hypothetical protein GINT2_000531 [Glugoides intestinalis]
MDVYFTIKKQRESIDAPVDNIGCYAAGKTHTGDVKKFQILISLLLSSQTKDEVTYEAVMALNSFLGVLTPTNVLNAKQEDIHNCIRKVGYHNKKTKFLISISQEVISGMPTTFEEVVKLPGIGKKMAYLYLYHACGKNEGIGVDTHVHRISNWIGLVKTKMPEQTRKELEKLFDKEEWPEIGRVLVGFGQTICRPVKPKCNECDAKSTCPYFNSNIEKGS